MKGFGRQDDGDRDKAALGEDEIGAKPLQKKESLEVALGDAENIGGVFQGKIAAQFAGGNAVVGQAGLLNQPLLHSVIRTDVLYLIPFFLQAGKKGDIRGHMTGCSAAGQYNFFHMKTPFSRDCHNH